MPGVEYKASQDSVPNSSPPPLQQELNHPIMPSSELAPVIPVSYAQLHAEMAAEPHSFVEDPEYGGHNWVSNENGDWVRSDSSENGTRDIVLNPPTEWAWRCCKCHCEHKAGSPDICKGVLENWKDSTRKDCYHRHCYAECNRHTLPSDDKKIEAAQREEPSSTSREYGSG